MGVKGYWFNPMKKIYFIHCFCNLFVKKSWFSIISLHAESGDPKAPGKKDRNFRQMYACLFRCHLIAGLNHIFGFAWVWMGIEGLLLELLFKRCIVNFLIHSPKPFP